MSRRFHLRGVLLRVSGGMGACMVTTGPGGTNAITGLAGAWLESTPVLFISGQVKRVDMKGRSGLRQLGAQELDIVEIVRSITKYAVTVTQPEEIRYHLEKAFALAFHGGAARYGSIFRWTCRRLRSSGKRSGLLIPPNFLQRARPFPRSSTRLFRGRFDQPVAAARPPGGKWRARRQGGEGTASFDREIADPGSSHVDRRRPVAGRPSLLLWKTGNSRFRGANFTLQTAIWFWPLERVLIFQSPDTIEHNLPGGQKDCRGYRCRGNR